MDATPPSTLQYPARAFFKVVKNKKQVILPTSISVSNLHVSSDLSGDYEVSPSWI